MGVVIERNFRRCDRDDEEARVSGRSRSPAAAFNRACRALLTLASISRRQTERLVSPVDSDPGIVENRRSQQHLVPLVVHLEHPREQQSRRTTVSRGGAVRGLFVSSRTVGRHPVRRAVAANEEELGNLDASQRRIQRGIVRRGHRYNPRVL